MPVKKTVTTTKSKNIDKKDKKISRRVNKSRRQKGGSVYTQEYIDNDDNYVEFEGEKYLLDNDITRDSNKEYTETDFATDPITLDKIKKDDAIVIPDVPGTSQNPNVIPQHQQVFDMNSLHRAIQSGLRSNPYNRKPFTPEQMAYVRNKKDIQPAVARPSYTQEYLDNDINYVISCNIEYLLDITVERNGRYTMNDLAKDPLFYSRIKRVNAIVIPGRSDVFDVEMAKNAITLPNYLMTAVNFTQEEKEYIQRKYEEYLRKRYNYTEEYLQNPQNYYQMADKQYLIDCIVVRNTRNQYSRSNLVKDPINFDLISKDSAILVPGNPNVFHIESLFKRIFIADINYNPLTRAPFTRDQIDYIKNKYKQYIQQRYNYTEEYLQNPTNYYKYQNIEYLLDCNAAKNNNYSAADLAIDPFTTNSMRFIPKKNAFLVPGHPTPFNISTLYYKISKSLDVQNPLTQDVFTDEQKAFIKNKYLQVVFKDTKVHTDKLTSDTDYVEFYDDLHVNDIIVLNNNKALYLADKLIEKSPIRHTVIHCKYREDTNNIFLIKLTSIKNYILKNNSDYNAYKKKIERSYKNVTPSHRLLNIDNNYSMQTIDNILSYFKFINFYGGKKYYGQIDVTPEILEYVSELDNKNNYTPNYLMQKIPHPPYLNKVKFSNIQRPVADSNITIRGYKFFSDPTVDGKSPNSLPSLSPSSISDAEWPSISSSSLSIDEQRSERSARSQRSPMSEMSTRSARSQRSPSSPAARASSRVSIEEEQVSPRSPVAQSRAPVPTATQASRRRMKNPFKAVVNFVTGKKKTRVAPMSGGKKPKSKKR
jgi:hypothetical protein